MAPRSPAQPVNTTSAHDRPAGGSACGGGGALGKKSTASRKQLKAGSAVGRHEMPIIAGRSVTGSSTGTRNQPLTLFDPGEGWRRALIFQCSTLLRHSRSLIQVKAVRLNSAMQPVRMSSMKMKMKGMAAYDQACPPRMSMLLGS